MQIVILNSELNSDRDVDWILCWQNVKICTEFLVQYPIKINQLPPESKLLGNLCSKVFTLLTKKSSVNTFHIEKITLSEIILVRYNIIGITYGWNSVNFFSRKCIKRKFFFEKDCWTLEKSKKNNFPGKTVYFYDFNNFIVLESNQKY